MPDIRNFFGGGGAAKPATPVEAVGSVRFLRFHVGNKLILYIRRLRSQLEGVAHGKWS